MYQFHIGNINIMYCKNKLRKEKSINKLQKCSVNFQAIKGKKIKKRKKYSKKGKQKKKML